MFGDYLELFIEALTVGVYVQCYIIWQMYVKSNNWLFIIFIEYKGFYNKLCECVRNDLGTLYELGIHSLRKVKKSWGNYKSSRLQGLFYAY